MDEIKYTCTIQTMGDDASDKFVDHYMSAMRGALRIAFPNAEIEVARNDKISTSIVEVQGDIHESDVEALADAVWDLMEV